MATINRQSAVALNTGLIPTVGFVFEQLSSDPSGGGLVEGRVWENTTTHLLKVYANSTVVTLATGTVGLTQEQVEDVVAAMVASGHTGATVTYTDNGASAGTLAVAVTDSPLLGGQNSAYHLARGNHSGTQVATTISDFSAAADARITNWVGAAPGALDTLAEIATQLSTDEGAVTTLTTAVAGKVAKLTAATITAGGTTTTITSTSRDCGVTVRFNDGDYEDVDAIVERPTTTSMLVRIVAQSRDVRVIPWQA